MSLKTSLIVAAAVTLPCVCALATEDIFQATFSATSSGAGDASRKERISGPDILRRALGEAVDEKELRRTYSLVYNATSDRLQVLRNDTGERVADVLVFANKNTGAGAAVAVGNRQTDRLVEVLTPSGAAVGEAVISERAGSSDGNSDRAKISGKLLFGLPAGTYIGASNPVVGAMTPGTDLNPGTTSRFYSLQSVPSETTGDTRIFSGTFTATKRFAAVPSKTSLGNSTQGAASPSDVSFLREAAQMNLGEVQLGRLIQQKAQSAALKTYGQMLEADHTAALAEISSVASTLNVSLPVTLTAADNGSIQKLANSTMTSFDILAQQSAIQAHERAIAVYSAEGLAAKNLNLRTLAGNQLQTLQQHLAAAQNLDLSGEGGNAGPGNTPTGAGTGGISTNGPGVITRSASIRFGTPTSTTLPPSTTPPTSTNLGWNRGR